MIGISVLVLTKNEEQDLPGCLKTISWSDDIHVYDSISSDKTVEIAEGFGAKVTQRAFDNWSAHQNWGLKNIAFKHSWVFYIDADERMTKDLIDAIKIAVNEPNNNVAFRVKRRDYFEGAWLRYVTPSPFNIRLFRPEYIEYQRLINPITVVKGSVGDLTEHFNHFPFSKGMTHWFNKHNSYSSLEAAQIIENKNLISKPILYRIKKLISINKNERRFYQKEFYYKLPFRPFIMFVLLYIFKLGFLDGRAGLSYSILRSIYEYMIVLKVRELQSTDKTQKKPLINFSNPS